MKIMTVIAGLFWLNVAAVVYTYAGYPLVLFIVARVRPRRTFDRPELNALPTVTVIITAYNEERDLAAKLDNTLALTYPPDKLDILVASDCSTDRTDDIVREYIARGNAHVHLHRQPVRLGKTAAQNAAVELARGDIILFSDATTMYQKNVLRAMLPNFADETVGCVAGKLIYVDASSSIIGKGARSYWNYETFLKESESRACSLIGTSGCLYAVRKSAYQPMYPEACSDFLIATLVYKQGLRTIYEPQAVCTEETNQKSQKEMQMRVRVISQTFTDLWRNREMLNPLKSGFFAIELISHKLLRYSVPVFLILMLLAAGIGTFHSTFFLSAFVLQLVFYATTLIAWLLEKNEIKSGVLAIPLYFVLTNLAAFVGFYKFLIGESYTHWEPIREKELR